MVAGVAIGAIGVLSGVIAGASVGTGVIVAVGMMVAVAIGVIAGVGVTVASSFREQLLRKGVLPRRRRRRARRRGNDFICAILPGEERHYQRVMNERLFFCIKLGCEARITAAYSSAALYIQLEKDAQPADYYGALVDKLLAPCGDRPLDQLAASVGRNDAHIFGERRLDLGHRRRVLSSTSALLELVN